MELFEEVFNRASIYDTLFFNIKAVLEYPTLNNLQTNNPALYARWQYLIKTKFTESDLSDVEYMEQKYQEEAVFHPEFCKILAITYAKLLLEDGKIRRYFKKISNQDEFMVIATFMDVLHQLSTDAVNSTPQYFMTMCGHNIAGYDIPLLLKRFILHRDKFENKLLPLMLKKALASKPWDGAVVDTVNVWKFGGNSYAPLMLIADFLNLKKTVDLEPLPEVSKKYWKMIADGGTAAAEEEALEYVSLQSATQTNLVIQLMNELRQL